MLTLLLPKKQTNKQTKKKISGISEVPTISQGSPVFVQSIGPPPPSPHPCFCRPQSSRAKYATMEAQPATTTAVRPAIFVAVPLRKKWP